LKEYPADYFLSPLKTVPVTFPSPAGGGAYRAKTGVGDFPFGFSGGKTAIGDSPFAFSGNKYAIGDFPFDFSGGKTAIGDFPFTCLGDKTAIGGLKDDFNPIPAFP
jgi:hypothetical protein